MSADTLHVTTRSPEETARLAKAIGARARGGEVIALRGDLGAGKTHFVKGLAEGLGVDPHTVTSPTFVLINEYDGRLHLYHFDTYRLSGSDDLEALGCQEMFAGRGVCAIEWADRVADCLPDDRLDVDLEHAGPTKREVRLRATGERHLHLLGPDEELDPACRGS